MYRVFCCYYSFRRSCYYIATTTATVTATAAAANTATITNVTTTTTDITTAIANTPIFTFAVAA